MAGETPEGDTGTPAAAEQSGAGYGNNALTNDVGKPGEEDKTMPDKPDD